MPAPQKHLLHPPPPPGRRPAPRAAPARAPPHRDTPCGAEDLQSEATRGGGGWGAACDAAPALACGDTLSCHHCGRRE
jgi:hypothetical protein